MLTSVTLTRDGKNLSQNPEDIFRVADIIVFICPSSSGQSLNELSSTDSLSDNAVNL